MEYAEHEFTLSAAQPDGRSLREHLESVQRQTGGTPLPLASGIELPEDADYLWQWFHRLSSRRQLGMAACPISWPQIESFFRVIGVLPDEWEVKALELIDNAWMESASKARAKQT